MSSSICFRAIKGWLAGCGAATAVIGSFGVLVIASSGKLTGVAGEGLAIVFSAVLIFIVTCVLTGIPAALVIWLSEKFRIRSLLFFGCTGALTGALSDWIFEGAFRRWPWPSSSAWLFVVVVAGFAAGVAYWRIAGRHAG